MRSSLTRSDFLKLSIVGLVTLGLRTWGRLFKLPDFPQEKRLGRVVVGKVGIKAHPEAKSQSVGALYEDAIVPWLREAVSRRVYGSPLVFRFWDRINDVRMTMLSGVLVASAALWTLGDDKVEWLPVLVIQTSVWILSGVSLVLVVLRDEHLLINLLPFGGRCSVMGGNKAKNNKSP